MLPTTITRWLVRYQSAIMFASIASYDLFVGLDDLWHAKWISAAVDFAIGLYFLGCIEDAIKDRRELEEAAEVIYTKSEAYRAQGYQDEADALQDLLYKEKVGNWWMITYGVVCWIGGVFVLATSEWRPLLIVAGMIMSIFGLTTLYTSQQPDELVSHKSGNPC